jgi:predicted RNA-binding Zn ribbon-like protein
MALTKSVHGPARDHTHELSLEDTFDFLNTIELENGFLAERLVTFEDAAAWLLERGIVHGDRLAHERISGADADKALARIRSVRGALREVSDAVVHRRTADRAALAEVNRALAGRERIELVQGDDGLSVGHSHVGDPIDDALSRLAEPLVDEVQAGNADRIRVCDNETCRWIFYDESRAGRRRWCDMASCGNRAKAARHRARVKAKAAAATPVRAARKASAEEPVQPAN